MAGNERDQNALKHEVLQVIAMVRLGLAVVLAGIPLAAQAGAVDASYYSRMANRPILLRQEPPPEMRLPPFKVFIVRNGTCPPGQLERYVSGSAQLGIGPSRSCITR